MSALRLTGGALRELRIHLCQKSSASAGVREYIEQNFVALRKENPRFPLLIRECSGIPPRVWARYEYGRETQTPLENMTSQQVADTIRKLAAEE